MPDKALARLQRVTDLFVTGRELVLDPDPQHLVLIWVAKMNAFQRGEATRDAVAAQARRMVGLHDEHDEVIAARDELRAMKDSEVIAFVLESMENATRSEARDDVYAEPDWYERRTLLQRAAELESDGSAPSDAEREQLEKIRADFSTAVDESFDKRMAEHRQELEADPEEARRRYLETWKRNQALNDFYLEFGRAELYQTIRDCQAKVRPGGGGYDHSACTHQRLLPNRAAVAELPEGLVSRVRAVLQELSMTPADAGFSAAPASSSGSSERHDSAEDSAPSSPTET